jgi:hypothetical protein
LRALVELCDDLRRATSARVTVAIVCGLVGCKKTAPPEELRKPRVDLTIWLDPSRDVPADDVTVMTAAPPTTRQMFERSGIHIAVVGVPPEGDLTQLLWKAIPEAEVAGSNATILVSTRCLKDMQPTLQQNLLPFWTVALVMGAHCEGAVDPRLGAMVLVEAGSASRVRITFDRTTRAFLKVEPIR